MEVKFLDIVELLKRSHGTDISVYDDSFVARSLANRQSATGNLSLNDYYLLLKTNWNEGFLFLDSLHIAYSEFFRNPLTFALLEQVILPVLWARKKKEKGNELRIWSSACASGQESYSIAILLDEIRESSSEKINFRIFATDNDQGEIKKAQEGLFGPGSMKKVTLKRIQTYFVQHEETYEITGVLKNYIDFSCFDLLLDQRACPTPSIYGNFDLVLCSNLLFYYKHEFRERILEKIGKTMAPGAYLISGETEREILMKYNYQEVLEHSAIFQKKTKL